MGYPLSFAAEIKTELISVKQDECCTKAELAAIIRMNGIVSTTTSNELLDIQTESAAIARRIFTLVKSIYAYPIELLVRKKMKLKKNNVYIVRMKRKITDFLQSLHIEHDENGFEQTDLFESVKNTCCKRAYMRGSFLARGSVNNPQTSSYHLEIFNLDQEHNYFLCELLNEHDLNAKELQRRNGYIVYIKEAEKITDFLKYIGAYNGLFKFEDVRIIRDVRNSVNRIVNCETANLNKTISASVRQSECIKFIRDKVGFDILPVRLREIAITRLEHPEVTLKELGELLPSGKLSKSGVNHRLKKIEEIAESLK